MSYGWEYITGRGAPYPKNNYCGSGQYSGQGWDLQWEKFKKKTASCCSD